MKYYYVGHCNNASLTVKNHVRVDKTIEKDEFLNCEKVK